MALQLSYEAPTGVTHATAYHRITGIRMDRTNQRVLIQVEIYKDKQARDDGKAPVGGDSQSVRDTDFTTYFDDEVLDVVDQNPTERAYVYLKTLDSYTGAADVLE